MNNDNNRFSYTYAAPTEQERSEVERIRRQYAQDGVESGIERLRKLDVKVKRAPLIVSVTLGVVGVLIFGLGLTMVLEWSLFAWGAVVAAVGVVPMAIAYPVKKALLKRNKAKYGDEILKLSDEILNNKGE